MKELSLDQVAGHDGSMCNADQCGSMCDQSWAESNLCQDMVPVDIQFVNRQLLIESALHSFF